MTAPIRIQLSRAKGWKMPPNTVNCARGPGRKWGNPCIMGDNGVDQQYACHAFENWLDGCKIRLSMYGPPPTISEIKDNLRGKNLACWCKIGSPCHADILLKLANEAKP